MKPIDILELNPLILISSVGAVILIAFISARLYKNTNDFDKSIKIYIPLIIGADIVFIYFKLWLIIIIGLDIFGFVIMALISNHYFYK